jgi:hypothetical protein
MYVLLPRSSHQLATGEVRAKWLRGIKCATKPGTDPENRARGINKLQTRSKTKWHWAANRRPIANPMSLVFRNSRQVIDSLNWRAAFQAAVGFAPRRNAMERPGFGHSIEGSSHAAGVLF